jgi:hypothetical protein
MAFRVRSAAQTFVDPWLHVEPEDCQPLGAEVAMPMAISWDLTTIATAIQDQVDDTVEPSTVVLGSKWEWHADQLYLPVVWRDAKGVGEGYVLVRPLVKGKEFELLIDVRVAGYLAQSKTQLITC